MKESSITCIAEVGSNFAGDLDLAKKYIASAAEAGANVVKFQTLTKETLIARNIQTQEGIVPNPVWDIFQNVGLPEDWHQPLKDYADSLDIEFLSTPFYVEAVALLESIGVKRYKIASGDITFIPLLERVAQTGKPVILSTGGSDLDDVAAAVNIFSEGGCEVTLLHCVVSYPPQWDELNLRAIATLRERFNCVVGVSDHSPGSVVPVAAVALGATVIEKHVTLDRSLNGPDHGFAMTFEEFARMVADADHCHSALGDGRKEPTDDERQRQKRFRRGRYNATTGEPSTGKEGVVWLRPQTWE